MRFILLCSLYEIYSWPHKSREMLYSKHELDKLCTLVKIQDSESHTLVDGTYMLRSPESVHLYPLPFPTPFPSPVHEQTLKLRMVKTKCIWPHALITTKAYLHRLPWIYNQLTLREILKSWGKRTVIWKLPTIPIGVVTRTFFSDNLYGNSCVRIHQIWIHCRDCGLLVLFFGLLWFFSYPSIFFIYMSWNISNMLLTYLYVTW